MKIISLTSLFFVLGASSIFSQGASTDERWFEGVLVTTALDTLQGELCYNMMTNTVKVQSEDALKVQSSFQTFHFKIWDDVDRRWRQFYSIPYALKNHHESPVLFEVLSEGKLSLLARESWKNTSNNDRLSKHGYLKKDFFFIDRDGNIAFCLGRKSQVIKLMEDHEHDIRRHIRELYLDDLSNERHLRRLTTFYNKLAHESEKEKEVTLARTSPGGNLILGVTKEGTQTWSRNDL